MSKRKSQTEQPHRRYNPLTGEWLLVSPQRTQRPWQGKQEPQQSPTRPKYDPDCYLCPGNERANGARNPAYSGTFAFTNDFSALLPEAGGKSEEDHPFIKRKAVRGTCRVITFSPRHDLTLPLMSREEIRGVVDRWAQETADLGKEYLWVQVFENKGEMMGCSNLHPHCQIWASDSLPNEALKEDTQQRKYRVAHKRPLLLDYLRYERRKSERVVLENEGWCVVVPYWAVWPFETLLIPKRHIERLPELKGAERDSLSKILKLLTIRYDNLFKVSFPYTMGWHGAPFVSRRMKHWQLHAHFYPPLLRSASVKKFMVGYEMLSEAQRDITAEQAAERLREMGDEHYSVMTA